MNILYHQTSIAFYLEKLGISNCYFKYFNFNKVSDTYTLKSHHHNDFELHFIINGEQNYDINGKTVSLTKGKCLLLPPKLQHRVIDCSNNTEKFCLTFKYNTQANHLSILEQTEYSLIETPENVLENIYFIENESTNHKSMSHILIESRIIETIILLFRTFGIQDNKSVFKLKSQQPFILNLAKRFISDNIKSAPSDHEVALHCNISDKQLTRIFLKYEEISTADYIKNQRLETAKKLLADKSLTLREISEQLDFGNEYYFNIFFKKAYGMPPGTYRKMI